ncbi:MAG: hypothetical protein M1358_01455, partial [Chloroflexi bacterium]|nr:hypothetical protein [Chloroflexota bacterium]
MDELENPKGRVAVAVSKIHRAAALLKNSGLMRWCRIQLGDILLTEPIQAFVAAIESSQGNPKKQAEAYVQGVRILAQAGVIFGEDITLEEVNVKLGKAGGGWQSIEVTEETRGQFARNKTENDGTNYIRNLTSTIAYVRREAHSRASTLYHKLELSSSASTAFA